MTDATTITIVGMILAAIPSSIAAIYSLRNHGAIRANTTLTEQVQFQTNGGIAHLQLELAGARRDLVGAAAEIGMLKGEALRLVEALRLAEARNSASGINAG